MSIHAFIGEIKRDSSSSTLNRRFDLEDLDQRRDCIAADSCPLSSSFSWTGYDQDAVFTTPGITKTPSSFLVSAIGSDVARLFSLFSDSLDNQPQPARCVLYDLFLPFAPATQSPNHEQQPYSPLAPASRMTRSEFLLPTHLSNADV